MCVRAIESEGIEMATSGIGRPVVLDEDSVRTLEKMLLRQKQLVEVNRDLVLRHASRHDFATVRTLSEVG